MRNKNGNRGDGRGQSRRYRERRKALGLPAIRGKLADPTRSMEARLANCVRNRRSWDKRHGVPFDLDLEFILRLYTLQHGRCAISGLQMTHAKNDLMSASVDAIDPSKGHVKGNVQIICLWANWAKNKLPNSAMLEVIKELRRITLINLLDLLAASADENLKWQKAIERKRNKVRI